MKNGGLDFVKPSLNHQENNRDDSNFSRLAYRIIKTTLFVTKILKRQLSLGKGTYGSGKLYKVHVPRRRRCLSGYFDPDCKKTICEASFV
jgi:hypothetical protein